MDGTPNATACSEFSALLEALKPVQGGPTPHEIDRYKPSSPEAQLETQVCTEDGMVASSTVELRGQLPFNASSAEAYFAAIVLGQQISEDKQPLDYLGLVFSNKVTVVSSASPSAPDTFEGTCLVEPNAMSAALASGALDRYEIGTPVVMDFQPYLDPAHVYHDIMGLHGNAPGRKEPGTTRLLAFTEELQVNSFQDLEAALMTLGTLICLTFCLGAQ